MEPRLNTNNAQHNLLNGYMYFRIS